MSLSVQNPISDNVIDWEKARAQCSRSTPRRVMPISTEDRFDYPVFYVFPVWPLVPPLCDQAAGL